MKKEKPLSKHIIEEANRCLLCKVPQCKKGCPVGTPVNEVIQLLVQGHIEQAGEKLFLNNPLSVVCSLICPHERFCEGHCVLQKKGSPIHFSSIENYISEYYLDKASIQPIEKNGFRIGIIGSGPAGITVAFVLALKGYDITIFESEEKIGGVMQYGIPDFRLPKSVLEKIKQTLLKMNIKIRPNTLIGQALSIDDLFRDGYQAIFIGTGVWRPNILKIKGESLGHVHYAINYLKNPDVYDLGRSVAIIGAGNVAMDVARTAIRKGSREVTVLFFRGENDITANKFDYEYAKIDGVKFQFYAAPVEFVDEGVIYAKVSEAIDANGQKQYVTGDDRNLFKADSVIIAISQSPLNNIVSTTEGIRTSDHGLIITDSIGRTTRPGVFASGDVVTGAKTVVEAVNLSKKTAEAIDAYVRSVNGLPVEEVV